MSEQNKKGDPIWSWLLTMIVIFICFVVFILIELYKITRTEKYCGTVVEKYIASAQGSKYGSVEHRLVFYCPTLGRKINIEVSANTYSNQDVANNVCFELEERQIK